MTATDALAGQGVRSALCIRLAGLGISEDDQQRHVCAVLTDGRARRRTELTERDARDLVRRLRMMTPDELAAVLATPAPEPEPTEPAGQQPAPAEVVEVVEVVEDLAEEQPPTGAAAEPAETGAPAVPVVVLEPPCRTPEEVEAAAVAAVDRFRAWRAAGIVPEPPARAAIPQRVPVVLGPAPDRTCPPLLCWCGGPGDEDGNPLPGACAHWRAAPPVDYSRMEGTKAYAQKHGRSWGSRTGGTWIDAL